MYGAEFCYHTIPDELDIFDVKTFESDPMEFYAVCTDITTGKAVYHLFSHIDRDELEWLRASASMPLVSRPVHIGDSVYLDGGPSDSIPLKFMEDKSYDRILVIETQPGDYVKGQQKFMPLVKVMLRKYPNMIECMEKRHLMYNEEKRYIREKEKRGEIIVVRPKEPLNISPVEKDPGELERVYQLGRKAGMEKVQAIKEFFE